jgi:4-amino-4-deoxy-L-arabinose transferase-like glycosyltransferase
VLLLFFIGRRLLPERDGQLLGLLAAALLALTVLHIQHAHFFVVDTFTTFFLLAAFLSLLRIADLKNGNGEVQKPRLITHHSSLITGLCWGAAMACKISAALFAIVIALFIIDRHDA